MNIVLKWIYKTLFSDLPRLVLTVVSIAVTFALLTGTGITLGSFARATDSLNEGIPRLLETILAAMLQVVFAITLYALFSVSLAERKNQYRIMNTAGCTTRQLLHGLTIEALSLDAAGAVIGVALGFLLAGWQLKTGGFPLIGEVFWDRSVWLKNILPALLIVPLTMLAASFQLFRPARDRRKRRGFLRRKSAFRRRLPRLFGTGGTLEYALTGNERRHHGALALALGANLAVVMLITACLFVFMNSSPESKDWDVWINYFADSGNDNAITARIDEILLEGSQDNSIRDYSSNESYLANCYALFDNAQISDDVFNFYRSASDTVINNAGYSVHPFDKDRQLACFTLRFFDEALFKSIAKDYGIVPSGNGAILSDFTSVSEGFLPLLKQAPDSLTLRFCPWDVWEKVGFFNPTQTCFDPTPLRNAPASLITSVVVSIDGAFSYTGENYYKMFQHGLMMNLGSFPTLLFPAHMREDFDSLLTKEGVIKSRFIRIRTDEPDMLCEKLKTSLDGLSGYHIVDFHFGGGTLQTFTGTSLYDSLRDQGTMNSIRINNVRAFENDYQIFLGQIGRFYRVILLLVFTAVGLNIVNTVHLNRLSRKQGYAVLASVGLDRRQRRQMLLTESLRYSVKGVLLALFLTMTAGYPLYYALAYTFNYEYISVNEDAILISFDRLDTQQLIIKILATLWRNLVRMWTLYWPPVVGMGLFLFFGFLLAEHLAMKKLEKDELVVILKDDMHE